MSSWFALGYHNLLNSISGRGWSAVLRAAHAGVFQSEPRTLADSHAEAEEAQESRHGTLGTSLTVRLNPLQLRLLLASQKKRTSSTSALLPAPSSPLGAHRRGRQNLSSELALL